MTREDAIELLAQRELSLLQRRDGDDAVLLRELKLRSLGVLNEYLQRRLGIAERVVGAVEVLNPCECCSFRTVHRDDGQRCPVCFWEQGGGGENRLTLQQAKQNFEALGAVDEWSVDAVLLDGPRRYAK